MTTSFHNSTVLIAAVVTIIALLSVPMLYSSFLESRKASYSLTPVITAALVVFAVLGSIYFRYYYVQNHLAQRAKREFETVAASLMPPEIRKVSSYSNLLVGEELRIRFLNQNSDRVTILLEKVRGRASASDILEFSSKLNSRFGVDGVVATPLPGNTGISVDFVKSKSLRSVTVDDLKTADYRRLKSWNNVGSNSLKLSLCEASSCSEDSDCFACWLCGHYIGLKRSEASFCRTLQTEIQKTCDPSGRVAATPPVQTCNKGYCTKKNNEPHDCIKLHQLRARCREPLPTLGCREYVTLLLNQQDWHRHLPELGRICEFGNHYACDRIVSLLQESGNDDRADIWFRKGCLKKVGNSYIDYCFVSVNAKK